MKMKFNTSEDLKKNTITNSKTDDTKRIIDDSIRSQNNINLKNERNNSDVLKRNTFLSQNLKELLKKPVSEILRK
tara:strand:+ start:1896 stop:2120 length:225 start_codon:yes stop_codon:yes gene_type:complete